MARSPTISEGAVMYCTNCGARLDGIQRFCSECGVAVPGVLAGSSPSEPHGQAPLVPIHRVISSGSMVVEGFVLPAVWLAAGIAGAVWYFRLPAAERLDFGASCFWQGCGCSSGFNCY